MGYTFVQVFGFLDEILKRERREEWRFINSVRLAMHGEKKHMEQAYKALTKDG